MHASTLDEFEHFCKPYVDFGLFLFALCNAGVQLNFIGPLTFTIFAALVAGKILGIVGFVMLASRLQLAPLPAAMGLADVTMVACMGSIGLTVALFISGEAFASDADGEPGAEPYGLLPSPAASVVMSGALLLCVCAWTFGWCARGKGDRGLCASLWTWPPRQQRPTQRRLRAVNAAPVLGLVRSCAYVEVRQGLTDSD